MLHLSTETYNNGQVSNVLHKIKAEKCLKMDYFGSNSRLDLMTGECTLYKTLLPLNISG